MGVNSALIRKFIPDSMGISDFKDAIPEFINFISDFNKNYQHYDDIDKYITIPQMISLLTNLICILAVLEEMDDRQIDILKGYLDNLEQLLIKLKKRLMRTIFSVDYRSSRCSDERKNMIEKSYNSFSKDIQTIRKFNKARSISDKKEIIVESVVVIIKEFNATIANDEESFYYIIYNYFSSLSRFSLEYSRTNDIFNSDKFYKLKIITHLFYIIGQYELSPRDTMNQDDFLQTTRLLNLVRLAYVNAVNDNRSDLRHLGIYKIIIRYIPAILLCLHTGDIKYNQQMSFDECNEELDDIINHENENSFIDISTPDFLRDRSGDDQRKNINSLLDLNKKKLFSLVEQYNDGQDVELYPWLKDAVLEFLDLVVDQKDDFKEDKEKFEKLHKIYRLIKSKSINDPRFNIIHNSIHALCLYFFQPGYINEFDLDFESMDEYKTDYGLLFACRRDLRYKLYINPHHARLDIQIGVPDSKDVADGSQFFDPSIFQKFWVEIGGSESEDPCIQSPDVSSTADDAGTKETELER